MVALGLLQRGTNSLLRASSHAAGLLVSQTSPSEEHTPKPYKQEHLLWQPGFIPRFVGTSVLLIALLWAAQFSDEAWIQAATLRHRLTFLLQRIAHRLEWWSAIGLLSSSCCVLQLILNSFSFGCAGFNTILGPLRPYMLALTAVLQGGMWHVALTGRGERLITSATGATILTLCLALLPEALHLWTHSRPRARVPKACSTAEVQLRVEGMGCTACTHKVKRTLEAIPGVSDCEVDFETSSARFELATLSKAEACREACTAALEAAGFKAALSGDDKAAVLPEVPLTPPSA